MANTITGPIVLQSNPSEVTVYFSLVCVSNAQETNTVVYSSSGAASLLKLADPKNCVIHRVDAMCSAILSARINLNFDASTPVVALSIPPVASPIVLDFCKIGGIPNQGGTGISGDVTITTTGLTTGDVITIILTVLR